eukprot:TRINITY_DN23418_c0_g1_i1.p1 TRINITY_DN23418_c0_g1~~TRINITY_DN23418_c0_g1_i1.p1  ORF type:complete len:322 (+),score=49.16 TRINITY_DN23418_c0_g1_i1:146-967(+)
MAWSDPKAAARTEKNYKSSEVVAQRAKFMEVAQVQEGESVLDVGCGPGQLLVELAEAVGTTGKVVGLDNSKEMLSLAQQRVQDIGQISLQEGGATALSFPDHSFDVVVFAQVLCYVGDVPAALAEVRRVLRPTGRVVILDTDWKGFVLNALDTERAERILRSHFGQFAHATLPRKLPALLKKTGFELTSTTGVPMLAAGHVLQEGSWVGNVVFHNFVQNAKKYSPSAEHPEDANGFLEEQRSLSAQHEFFGAVNRYIFVAKPVSKSSEDTARL